MRRRGIAAAVLGFAVLASNCASIDAPSAADDEESELLLHSDVPLWASGSEPEKVWPEHFASDDSFGCSSRVAFGRWLQTSAPDGEGGAPDTVSRGIGNYGVFHCAAVFSTDDTSELGYIIELGHDEATGLDLYAFQIGVRPGSTYEVLASTDTGRVTHFTVLRTDCSAGQVRGGRRLDIFLTEYCSVPSRQALIAIARRAAQRPPSGTLELVPEPAPARPAN